MDYVNQIVDFSEKLIFYIIILAILIIPTKFALQQLDFHVAEKWKKLGISVVVVFLGLLVAKLL